MAQTDLRSRLKRLFATNTIVRRIGKKRLQVVDSNKLQSWGNMKQTKYVDRFSGIHTRNPGWSTYNNSANYHQNRVELYTDYEGMDMDPILSSALDIYADECTVKDTDGDTLTINSPDDNVRKILHNLFYDVLNVEFNLWMWVRQMCKYGDFFLKLEIAEKFGVYNVIPYTAYHIERLEGQNPENPSEVRFKWNPEGFSGGSSSGYYNVAGANGANDDRSGIIYDNYEMAHFRMVGDVNYLPYGRSYIEPARKLFKQYTLMEDAMLIHRIARAPEKRVFYVNVGAIPPNEVEAFMQKTINNMKRTPMMDEKTGEYNLKYNMQNMLEDFYIPVRGNDSATKIETTPGLQYDGIADVEYLREKLFAALKVPKSFMGYGEGEAGKSTLAQQDIRFARTIDRIQRILLSELQKIALVHLYTQGFRDETLTNFELSMTTPSIIYDQERIELMKSKSELAGTLLEQGLVPSDWIYHNVYHFSEDQYDEYRDLVREDSKRKFRNDQILAEGNDPVESGQSYGTPHDLASLYGKGRTMSDPANVPDGYADDLDLGRPKDGITNRGKQDNNFGKDPLGVKTMKDIEKPKARLSEFEDPKITYLKNKDIFKGLDKKQLIFEQDKADSSLLDESRLKS